MKRLNTTKEAFNRSKYLQKKYGKLEYVSESGKLYRTSKGQVLKFAKESSQDEEYEFVSLLSRAAELDSSYSKKLKKIIRQYSSAKQFKDAGLQRKDDYIREMEEFLSELSYGNGYDRSDYEVDRDAAEEMIDFVEDIDSDNVWVERWFASRQDSKSIEDLASEYRGKFPNCTVKYIKEDGSEEEWGVVCIIQDDDDDDDDDYVVDYSTY